MKFFIPALCSLVLIANQARASIDCVGETKTGKVVTVSIDTHGTDSHPVGGRVEVKDAQGTVLKLTQLPRTAESNSIIQYFESCRDSECVRAIVGLEAMTDEGMVDINYVGLDYSNQSIDIEKALKQSGRKKMPENSMRVPYQGAYLQFTDVLCQLGHDV